MVKKPWKIIPRPLLETVLNNHVQHHRVSQPLILHGPRGVGKTTLILNRLLNDWNKGPHVTGYVDFGSEHSSSPWTSWSNTPPPTLSSLHSQLETCLEDFGSEHSSSPWTSWSNTPPPTLSSLHSQLETCLEDLVEKGIRLGSITSQQVFSTLNKWHGINSALRRIIQTHSINSSTTTTITSTKDKVSNSVLWSRAIFAISSRVKTDEIDDILRFNEKGKVVTLDEKSYFREAWLSLRLAKEVIGVHQKWKANAVSELNRTGGYSRSLANSCTDWPCLLLDLLSSSAEIDYFQPKLIINNIEILRYAITDDSSVSASMYHDSLLWRLIALGINERSLPIILVTSDGYYSYRATYDFGHPDIFISRETFGWTPLEAKMHMVSDYFSESEWKVIAEVLGSNSRHLSELYALKQSGYHEQITQDFSGSLFEDIVDAYLAHLQVTVVNPAMESVLSSLQKFAIDVCNGKVSKDCLSFGAPWRNPPRNANPTIHLEWAKIQLMDFVQSLVNAEFGLDYFSDYSLEIFEDPCATAMMEVGLLYTQRDPPYIRPISRGIQRCLVRWLVQERMQMSILQLFRYLWQRVIRGRSYRHLMREAGYK